MLQRGSRSQDIRDCEKALASAHAKFEASRVASKEALLRLDTLDQGFRRQSRKLSKIGHEAVALQEELGLRSGKSSPERSPRRSPEKSYHSAHETGLTDVDVRDLSLSSKLAARSDKEDLQAAKAEIAELAALVNRQESAVEAVRQQAKYGAAQEMEQLKTDFQKSQDLQFLEMEQSMLDSLSLKDEQLRVVKAELVEVAGNHEHLMDSMWKKVQLSAAADMDKMRVEFREAQTENAWEIEERTVEIESLKLELENRLETIKKLESQSKIAAEEAQRNSEHHHGRSAEGVGIECREIKEQMTEKLDRLLAEAHDKMLEVEEQCMVQESAKQASQLEVRQLENELAATAHAAAEQRSRDEKQWKDEAVACAETRKLAEVEIENMRIQCKLVEEAARSEAKSQFMEEITSLESRCNRLKEENGEASSGRQGDKSLRSMPEIIDGQGMKGTDKRESGFAAGPNEASSFSPREMTQVTSSPRGPGGTLNVPVVRGPLSPRDRASASIRKSAIASQAKKSLGRSSMKSLGVRFQCDESSDEGEHRYSVAESEFWIDSAACSRAGSILQPSSDTSEEDSDTSEEDTRNLATRRATSTPPDFSRHTEESKRESYHEESRRSKKRDSATVAALDLPLPRQSQSAPNFGRTQSGTSSAGRTYGSTKSGLHMRERFSTNARGTVSRTATSEECGQCLTDGILNALRMHALHEFRTGAKPPIAAFKDVRTLELVTEAEREIQFEFEVVAPDVFRDLRRTAFGVEDQSFADSIGLHPLSGGRQGEGKSGSLFFFSWDKRYLVKTTDAVEVPFFFDGLDLYHKYMRGGDFSPGGGTSSFLPRYLGFYGLKILNDVKSYLVVFENIFPPGVTLKEKYDLKGVLGSKRFVTEEQLAQGIEVLKDRNFLNRSLNVGEKMKQRLATQLKKDVTFLEERGRIDYSLLLGVASIDDVELKPNTDVSLQWPTIECHGLQSVRRGGVPGDEVFFLGIIDVLQEYTKKKAAENKFRSLKHGLTHMLKTSAHADSSNAVSAVPPPQYAKRFYDFLVSKME